MYTDHHLEEEEFTFKDVGDSVWILLFVGVLETIFYYITSSLYHLSARYGSRFL